jgi:hypothetical protein
MLSQYLQGHTALLGGKPISMKPTHLTGVIFTKTFLSVNYQANQLLVTPSLGINTSTGQKSELINVDFEQQVLTDGAITVICYEVEGLYKGSFMREFPDLVNGNPLKGNYLTMGLETTAPSGILVLFTTEVSYNHSYQNIR